jgi:hypothetical protein
MDTSSIWLYSCYNCDTTNTYLNANGTNNGSLGVSVDGGSQAINLTGNQFLGYSADVAVYNGSLAVQISGNVFDFCYSFCVLLQGGSMVTIGTNTFDGEGGTPYSLAGNIGVHVASAFSGPVTIMGNVLNGFSGAGAWPLEADPGAIPYTYAWGNTYTNNGSNTPTNFPEQIQGHTGYTTRVPNLSAAGSPPALSGTCATNTQVGGSTAGTFHANCTSGTVIISPGATATNGWVCNAQDQSTAGTLEQTANSTASVTLTIGTATTSGDVIAFSCVAF